MESTIFPNADKVWSRWHGQRCPICKEGTLFDGVRFRTKEVSGISIEYKQIAAWCNTCGEGIIINDPIREVDMEDFFAAQHLSNAP